MPSNEIVRDLARERIDHLFGLAAEYAPLQPELSDRYVQMALKLSKRTRVRIPKHWKYFVCKSCHSFLYPGSRSRVRISQERSPHVVVTCLVCGEKKRFILDKKSLQFK